MSVGKSIAHDSAIGHVTGKADYLDDLPRWENELVVGTVGSPVASGVLEAIDIREASELPGVAVVLTHADIPGHKTIGPIICDEPVLAFNELTYIGQPVVVIAAKDNDTLRQAMKLVKLTVRETPAILSIEEAIEARRFIGPARTIRQGNASEAIDSAPHRLAGCSHVGGQEQFYFESQVALAVPGDDGQMTVHSSTQNTTEIQFVVAEVLGVGSHKVVAVCKRMGGAFGGKETQAALPAAFVAMVANRTGQPARIVYSKDDDMQITGKRHAYRADWEIGYDDRGVIQGLRVQLHSNGGASADLSTSVMERTMLHMDNAYHLPHAEIHGQVCFTNYPPNTAFRGFGGPQAIAIIESIIEEIAIDLGLDSYEVRSRNLYSANGDQQTPYGQIVKRNHLPEIMPMLAASSKYVQRRAAIAGQGSGDPFHLRGISMVPVKFGISFTSKFLNQANALVNVYQDGTVQVSTGGTEMGQGLNTKIRQIVADELGVSWQNVIVMPTSTEKNNNTSPTAASAGTDLNGAAAADACRQIRERLTEFAARRFTSLEAGRCESPDNVCFEAGWVFDDRNPDATRIAFGELTKMARLDRVDLGARGFYKTPGVDFNRETGKGSPFLYYTQGAAVAEVRIDRFTGEIQIVQLDLLMDIGESINPGIDLGQIRGGFVQGMGWCTTEALVYDSRGKLLSHSPTTYKIPGIGDIPDVFNCELFENSDNVLAIRRSKAVGEPPLLLGVCVWTAVKHALSQLSPEAARSLRLPATSEEILRCIELPTTNKLRVEAV